MVDQRARFVVTFLSLFKMKKSYSTLLLLAIFLLVNNAKAQTTIKDYLSVPGPITFDTVSYALSWSSHPSDHYYKLEYLPNGADPEKFKQMLMIEFVEGEFGAKDAVNLKIAELKELKKTNPVVNYDIMEKKGEYLLDFVVSQNSADGRQVLVLERNVYHYKKVQDASGRRGILLFAVSTRSYGNEIDTYFSYLKAHRNDMINDVARYSLPVIKVVDQP